MTSSSKAGWAEARNDRYLYPPISGYEGNRIRKGPGVHPDSCGWTPGPLLMLAAKPVLSVCGQDIDHEDQGGVCGYARLLLIPIPQIRGNDDQDL